MGSLIRSMRSQTAAVVGGTISGLDSPIAVADGGTGAVTVAAAQDALRVGKPRCLLSAASGQSFASSASEWRTIAFDGETYDADSMHDNATNNTRITIPAGEGGTYSVFGQVTWGAHATGIRTCRVRKNAASTLCQMQFQATSGGVGSSFAGCVAQLSAADYIEIEAQQNSGTTLSINTQTSLTFFGAARVGA